MDKVKRSESGMIVDPVTIGPKNRIADALEIMKKYHISGVPVTLDGKLVGILTNRDLRFEDRLDLPVEEVMTRNTGDRCRRHHPGGSKKEAAPPPGGETSGC